MTHAGHAHAHGQATAQDRLRIAFVVTSGVLVLEAVGGLLIGSVALLADAGHMLIDAGALAIALFAGWVAAQPRDRSKSFGYGRAEILGALANGVLLGGVSVAIAIESISRLRGEPGHIDAGWMIGIAGVGLVANLVSAAFLSGAAQENLNVRAALFHVLGDALGSVAAIAAGLAIWLWDYQSADALAGLFIALLLVASAFRLVREAVDILLEGAPRHLDLQEIAGEVGALPGVLSIHDLHIWTVSSGFPAMSAHLDLQPGADHEQVRRAAHQLLHQRYAIAHTTIQTEEAPALLSIQPPPTEA